MRTAKQKNLDSFITLIPKLEPIEFLGISKILCIKVVDKDFKPRLFTDIFESMLEKFSSIGKKQQKEILKVMKDCIKEKE